MDDLLSEFLAETNESIEVLDVELVALEQDPNNKELLSNIFRVLHTIKGTCGFLGLPRLEAVAHAGENVLGKFRDGELDVAPDAVSLILEAMDTIKQLVGELGRTGAEPEGEDGDLIGRLNALAGGAAAEDAPAAPAAPAAEAAPAAAAPKVASAYERVGGLSTIDAAVEVFYQKVLADDRVQDYFAAADMDVLQGLQREYLAHALGGPDAFEGAPLIEQWRQLQAAGLTPAHFDQMAEHLTLALEELEVPEDAIGDVVAAYTGLRAEAMDAPEEPAADSADAAASELAAEAPAAKAAKPAAEDGDAGKAGAGRATPAQSIRVAVDVLENLMTVVSELVLTRNELLQILRSQKDTAFATPLQRLNQVTTELQEGVMQTRMQPIGNAWVKLPRLIRDLSHELGKKIELEMLGAETELDRQVLDMIKDPLTHMVRNAADHGLETPEGRRAAGKSEVGRVTLSARHEGGHIIMEIVDDGCGLSVEKLKERAIVNGLISEAEVESLSDQQIYQFIFKPGFSTAKEVTNVSGRGVGMDVVRSNIAEIGGSVELTSVEGKGSRFIIKIPLTLAIISALIVECCGERFAMPQNSVTELVRTTSTSSHTIETINDVPVLRLRDRLLPLVSLEDLLGLKPVAVPADDEASMEIAADAAAPEPEDETAADAAAETEPEAEGEPAQETVADRLAAKRLGEEAYIIVTQVGAYTFGIIVDRVFDTEEIVVKPVSKLLRELSLFSGNTILGDGSVIMILDPNGIASVASGELAGNGMEDAAAATRAAAAGNERSSLLVFRDRDEAPKAFPLGLVARLEEIDVDKVEQAAGRTVIQYRGRLMPLIASDGSTSFGEGGRKPVLVFAEGDSAMGVVVDEIVDIIESAVDIQISGGRPGVVGSAIIEGRAIDLLDAGYYVRQAGEDTFGQPAKSQGAAARNVLLVDDSPFLQNLLAPLLANAGYAVTFAEDADAALSLLQESATFDAVVSNFDKPELDGQAFVDGIRDAVGEHTPIIALSASPHGGAVSRVAPGSVANCVSRFDYETLLNALSNTDTGLRGAA